MLGPFRQRHTRKKKKMQEVNLWRCFEQFFTPPPNTFTSPPACLCCQWTEELAFFKKAVHKSLLHTLMCLALHTTTGMKMIIVLFIGLPVLALAPCLLLGIQVLQDHLLCIVGDHALLPRR